MTSLSLSRQVLHTLVIKHQTWGSLSAVFEPRFEGVASPEAQMVKNLPAMQETWVLIPELGGSPGEGNSYPLHYSGLENSMDGEPGGV